eukprot:3351276-Pleurochrysis_carterae.AAC.3
MESNERDRVRQRQSVYEKTEADTEREVDREAERRRHELHERARARRRDSAQGGYEDVAIDKRREWLHARLEKLADGGRVQQLLRTARSRMARTARSRMARATGQTWPGSNWAVRMRPCEVVLALAT